MEFNATNLKPVLGLAIIGQLFRYLVLVVKMRSIVVIAFVREA